MKSHTNGKSGVSISQAPLAYPSGHDQGGAEEGNPLWRGWVIRRPVHHTLPFPGRV